MMVEGRVREMAGASSIKNVEEMERFKSSGAYKTVREYIDKVDGSIREGRQGRHEGRGVDIDNITEYRGENRVAELMATIYEIMEEVPIEQEDQRYGNKGFATFCARIKREGKSLIKNILFEEREENVEDVSILFSYLNNSFGNPARLDYGTGHELTFFCLVVILHKFSLLEEEAILGVMEMYFAIVRMLILKYKLEPAGSHGTWGIDDYQLLPFLFGSSQVCEQGGGLSFEDLFREENQWLCYSKSLRFVHAHKRGPKGNIDITERVQAYREMAVDPKEFSDHSPMVYSLRALPWHKINRGMIRMYESEVLSKFVVIQHFVSSRVLPV
jgi:serine/threonine-protein phosphatase 2A activator